eukprot:NODE_56_length_28873_cov_1.243101.p4 type:complete len:549 gc:universal NODE_56_length_28873_cov_1.243101:16220-14574(-)
MASSKSDFELVVAPKRGPLLCLGPQPYYVYADKSSILVPKSTTDIIPITVKYAKRVVCTIDQPVKNPGDIENNLLKQIKLVAKSQPILYENLKFKIKELEPDEECLLLRENTILEIICKWTRPILDVELYPHKPVMHLYIGYCDVEWPCENVVIVQGSLDLKEELFDEKIEEALKYQPCIIEIKNFEYMEKTFRYYMGSVRKLENQAVIIAAESTKDIADIPGLWITRHHRTSLEIKQRLLNKICEEFDTSVSIDLERTDINSIPEIVWKSKIKDVDIQKGEQVTPIIGLEAAKKALESCIMRPLKYKKLYQSLPTLSKGVLLYGMTGTGKSCLAKEFIRQSGLSHKIVKGPEIISKYIGETERNIRDIFTDALNRSPFVILFDEIDCLVPKRGHDSSGITDRIVNQFLTVLDGSEELRNVYVIGTTSQPDVIDPAILRPGRLDTHVECEFLTESEFQEAVEMLCQKYDFDGVKYHYVKNCTVCDIEAEFLNIYYDFISENRHTNGIGNVELNIRSSVSQATIEEYLRKIDRFKGKRKPERMNDQTLA